MPDMDEGLEKLLAEVRKTISDNRQFLDKLVDEACDDDSEGDGEQVITEEEFEEL